MKSAFVVAILAAAVGCGDNHHNNMDGGIINDANKPDAAVDASIPQDAFVECNYTEQDDSTNDFNVNNGIEQTGLHFKPGDTRTICGNVNNGQFGSDGVVGTIDVDNYGITLDADSDVLVTLTPPPNTSSTPLGLISSVELIAYSDQTQETVQVGYFETDHAVYSAHLPAGTYELAVDVTDNQDAAMTLPYEMRITTDDPDTRCAQLTGTATYTEANDGASNTANNVIDIDSTGVTLLGAGENQPEPTGLAVLDAQNYLFDGSSASEAAIGDYYDMDTYLISSGANTNQLSVRVDWATSGVDLDLYVIPATHTLPILTSAAESASGLGEAGVTAVTPNTPYWISIGAATADTTMADLPITYGITVCGQHFTQGP
jgi:hypothetical protein